MREFSFDADKNYSHYQIQLTMDQNIKLSELQLLKSDYQFNKTNEDYFLRAMLILILNASVAGVIIPSVVLPIVTKNTKKMKRALRKVN
jgi:hypothetical protein